MESLIRDIRYVSVTLGEAPPNDKDDSILADGYEHLFGQIVSENYFNLLGAEMVLGRPFSSSEGERPGESAKHKAQSTKHKAHIR